MERPFLLATVAHFRITGLQVNFHNSLTAYTLILLFIGCISHRLTLAFNGIPRASLEFHKVISL